MSKKILTINTFLALVAVSYLIACFVSLGSSRVIMGFLLVPFIVVMIGYFSVMIGLYRGLEKNPHTIHLMYQRTIRGVGEICSCCLASFGVYLLFWYLTPEKWLDFYWRISFLWSFGVDVGLMILLSYIFNLFGDKVLQIELE